MFAKCNVTLIGFPSSGKSTLGRSLAQSLNRPFIDVDELIQNHHSSFTCREICYTYGEDYFRFIEAKVIEELESLTQPTIIAAGGGSLLQEKNGLSLKKHSRLIYLQTPSSILKERLLRQTPIPFYLNTEDPEKSFQAFYESRLLIYEKWADQTVMLTSPEHQVNLNDLFQFLNL